jgi:alcohol dehydrogenase class IV
VDPFTHHMPTRLLVGLGSLDKLGEEVARINRRCIIVTGRRAARLTGLLERVQDALLEARIESVLFDQVEPNPTIDTIRDGAAFARSKQARWVLGVGGGSAIDAAKAIALTASGDEDISTFFSGARPSRPPLPVVAIPTTSGTGSEVTPFAVVTDVSAGDKVGLAMPQLFPRLAILDPQVTTTMPESVTVDTGLDAMCHAIEALFSTQRSLLSDLYARSALDRIVNHLPAARSDPNDLDARAELQLASTFAGMAIANTATLVPHAMGYPVTVRYDLPHGRVTALLMPAFLERLLDQEPDRVAFVGQVLGDPDDPSTALRKFIESLGVAPRLGAYGVLEKDIEIFSRQAKDKAHLKRTPGEWLEETLQDVYRRSL